MDEKKKKYRDKGKMKQKVIKIEKCYYNIFTILL